MITYGELQYYENIMKKNIRERDIIIRYVAEL